MSFFKEKFSKKKKDLVNLDEALELLEDEKFGKALETFTELKLNGSVDLGNGAYAENIPGGGTFVRDSAGNEFYLSF